MADSPRKADMGCREQSIRQPQDPPPFPKSHEHSYDKHHDQKHHCYGGYGDHHKKKSLLKDLFDF